MTTSFSDFLRFTHISKCMCMCIQRSLYSCLSQTTVQRSGLTSARSRVADVSISQRQRRIGARQGLTRANVSSLVFANTHGRLGAASLTISIAVSARMVGLSAQSPALLHLRQNDEDDDYAKNCEALHLVDLLDENSD